MNRAIEFLREAAAMAEWYQHRLTTQTLIRLAMGEVRELEARIAELEARPPAPATAGVLIVEAAPMMPASLTATQRVALPGNGKGEVK